MLRNARANAVKARTQALIHLEYLVVTAPDEPREAVTGLTNRQLIRRCARMHRPGRLDCMSATKARCGPSRRHQALDAEVKELEAQLKQLITDAARRLLREPGFGPEIAAGLLLLAGDNSTCIRNDSASPPSAAPLRAKPPAARPPVTASTAAATVRPAAPCG